MSMIYGERVRLRAAERSDLDKFVEWVNDPEVTAGLTLFCPCRLWTKKSGLRLPCRNRKKRSRW